jgi:hypothetical protein
VERAGHWAWGWSQDRVPSAKDAALSVQHGARKAVFATPAVFSRPYSFFYNHAIMPLYGIIAWL